MATLPHRAAKRISKTRVKEARREREVRQASELKGRLQNAIVVDSGSRHG
jgi:hypothetical protein